MGALLAVYILGVRLRFPFSNIGILSGLMIILIAGREYFVKGISFRWILFAGIWALAACYQALMAVLWGYDFVPFALICVGACVSILIGEMVGRYLLDDSSDGGDVVYFVFFVVVAAALLNSSIILAEYFLDVVKSSVEGVLAQNPDANIDYSNHPFRLRGIAAGGGAALSIYNAVALFFLVGIYSDGRIKGGVAVSVGLVICVSNVFTGRTGLMFGIIAFSIIIFLWIRNSFLERRFGSIFFLLAILIVAVSVANQNDALDLDPALMNWAFEWIGALDGGGSSVRSVDDLSTMLFLPDKTSHLLFGIGFFEGNDGLYGRTDSGYLKTIFSIGFVGAVVLYGSILAGLWKVFYITKSGKLLFFLMLLMMLFSEVKEPFLYQNYAGRALFVLAGVAGVAFDFFKVRQQRQ